MPISIIWYQRVSNVRLAVIVIPLFSLLIGAGCSTYPEQGKAYATADAPIDTQTDAIQGLDPVKNSEYPMLYHRSPGMRRLNDAHEY